MSEVMKTKTLLRSVGLFGAGALAATLTPAISAVDVGTYTELDQFMSVFERVRVD